LSRSIRRWEMLGVAGDNVVGFGCLSAFEKAIVSLVRRDRERGYWLNQFGDGPNRFQQRGHNRGRTSELGTAQDLLVFFEDDLRRAELDVAMKGQTKRVRGSAGWTEHGRHHDVGVEHDSHQRLRPFFSFSRRLRRISASMSRMFILATPERLAVAQLRLSQAGAGAMVSR